MTNGDGSTADPAARAEARSYALRRLLLRTSEILSLGPTGKLVTLGCLVGILAGIVAILFTHAADWITVLAIGVGGEEEVHFVLEEIPRWRVLLIPAIGGLVVGPLVTRYAPETSGHGVPEVMAAVTTRGGRIRKRVTAAKFVASSVTIGTGGSVGREGPIIQIGSAVGSTIGQWLGLDEDRIKVLVGCGAAAGIAATFNAPISGAFFALEVILGSFALPSFSPIVLSSVLATVVARAYLGDHPAFFVPEYELVSALEIPLHVGVGIAAALVGVVFIRVLAGSEDAFRRLPVPAWIRPAVGGLALGGIYLVAPRLYGSGYSTLSESLALDLPTGLLLLLLLGKLLATSITLGSGGSGGIFAPSPFLGGVLGAAIGNAAQALGPSIVAQPGAYALVGMAAMVAATTHAPIAALLILFEMSGDYRMILPLMLACTVSTLAARKVHPDSIYTLKLVRQGISAWTSSEARTLARFKVRDVMESPSRTFRTDAPLGELTNAFFEDGSPLHYVVHPSGSFAGTVTVQDVLGAIGNEELGPLVVAYDLAHTDDLTLAPDDDLAQCLSRFTLTERDRLPVVEGDQRILVGFVTERAVASLYHREVLRKGVLGVQFLPSGTGAKVPDVVQIGGDHRLEYLPVRRGLAGRTLRDLDLRARFGITVLAIRRQFHGFGSIEDVPKAEDRVHEGDVLVLLGSRRDVDALEKAVAEGRV